MNDILLKRIYEPYDIKDGYRVLVDRLWPRGVSKAHAKLSDWAKDVAPSTELRKWFSHDPSLFKEFEALYLEELRTDLDKIKKVDALLALTKSTTVTLLFAARDTVHNHPVILKEELERLKTS